MVFNVIPSKEECIKILEKYKTPPQVIQHCLLVTEIAENFCDQISEVKKEIVIAGSMLHDIGRSITHSISHAVKGVQILEGENLDPRVLAIIKNHIGTGITKDEAVKLGLPAEEYIPLTIKEIIVSYSDNLVTGNRKCSFEEKLQDFENKFGQKSHVVKGFLKQRRIIENSILKSGKRKDNSLEKKSK